MTRVFEGQDWYVARPEPEVSLRGTFRERTPVAGPRGRASVSFALVQERATYAVYAGSLERILSPFVGREVTVRGKLVDLSQEGFGVELWIATIGAG